MQIPFAFGYPGNIQTPSKITLHNLVACLLPNFHSITIKQKVHILNDVPCGFCVTTDENLLASVISTLMVSLSGKSRNSCIKITAKRYRNIILLHMKDTYNRHVSISSNAWEELNPLAKKLGGCIVTNQADSAAITLSFRCLSNIQ